MKAVVKKNRELGLINAQNTQNENRAETITLVVPEEYEDYNKKIVFILPNNTRVSDIITNNTYQITNAITQYEEVEFYIWLTKGNVDFRTKTKPLKFYHNENASNDITPEQIGLVNTVVNLLEEEIDKVENLDLDVEKIGTVATLTLTKKDGTTKEVEITDGTDGQDGYTPQKGVDYFTQEDIQEIENGVKTDLQETVLIDYSLITETGSKINLSINTTNYKLTAILKDKNNNTIYTSNEIDLPLETMVVSASYDNTTKEIILTLQNGNTVRFSVADLVSGLVSETQLQTILANYYTKTEINNLLANKVDRVAGKELSTNDFTDEYKEQIDTNTDDISDIQEEQTQQNTNIENLQTENARLKATLKTTTVTGQDITLNKTAELEFKKPPLPMGNSEQDGEPSPDNEVSITNVTGNIEINLSNSDNTKEHNLPLTLGSTELCKIGNYQDYFYKENNKWYLHKEIEKRIFNGTENWTLNSNVSSENYKVFYLYNTGMLVKANVLCNNFTYINSRGTANCIWTPYSTELDISISYSIADTVEAFKTWLSTYNTIVYYPLATPTNTEITDTTLISQLEAINNILSYEGQTNISSNQNAIFNVEAYLDSKIILAEKVDKVEGKGLSTNDFTNTYKNSVDSNTSARHTHTNKTVLDGIVSSDITNWNGKQNETDNSLNTTNKTITGAINEVYSIARGANQAVSYSNYQSMITAFNSLANDVYNVGQNVMIVTLQVPDLWISSIESTSVPYTYTTDEAFTTALATNGYVQVGYYKLSALETQKVDLTDYEQNTNKTTTISSSSTNTQYPSAKAVYDYIQSLDGDEVSY